MQGPEMSGTVSTMSTCRSTSTRNYTGQCSVKISKTGRSTDLPAILYPLAQRLLWCNPLYTKRDYKTIVCRQSCMVWCFQILQTCLAVPCVLAWYVSHTDVVGCYSFHSTARTDFDIYCFLVLPCDFMTVAGLECTSHATLHWFTCTLQDFLPAQPG